MKNGMLNIGDICRAIGPGVTLQKAFIEETLGVPPTTVEKAARFFDDAAVVTVLEKMQARIGQVLNDAREGMLDVPEKPAAEPRAPKGQRTPPPPAAEDEEL